MVLLMQWDKKCFSIKRRELNLLTNSSTTNKMSNNNKEINPGGVNGLGEGVVNVNSEEYKFLKKAINEHYSALSTEERIKYELISIQFKMKKTE